MNGSIRIILIVSMGMTMLFIHMLAIDKYRIEAGQEFALTLPQSRWNDGLSCLQHLPTAMNSTDKPGSDPSKTILEHQSAARCGFLRRNWLSNPPLSEYARHIDAHQSNCEIPLATHHFDNTFGLGSHLVLWGQAMCNGMQLNYRLRSHAPKWLWLDRDHCDMHQAIFSPMQCYFPAAENKCSKKPDSFVSRSSDLASLPNITDPRVIRDWCEKAKESDESRLMIRAASTEYLFQEISPLVIREAKRQIGIIFPNGVAPDDLVTVHIRWGDKFWEMDLPPIEEYISAIHTVLSGSTKLDNSTLTKNASSANIYLATEDPKAYQEFMAAKPEGWNVYADITLLEIDAFRPPKGNRASWAARNTNGRAGLVALASVLVAMESNLFVLTTKSNWSTIMNHLRTNIIDPRCNNCTTMIDLRPGAW